METLPGSDYHQLRAFVAVAEVLSFSRAAESLRITPSALSQTIRGLEESLGISLFHRTTRSVSLTLAGENLYQRVRPALVEMSDAVMQTRLARERPSGTVRVHSFRSAVQSYLEPMLPDFLRAYPEILVDITLSDEVVDIVARGFDVSLRIGEVIEQDMIAVRLGPELRQIAVASPDYIRRHGTPRHPRDLLQHACIGWRWPGHQQPYAWEFFENERWFEVTVNGPLIVNDKQVGARMAVSGVGIAFCVEDAIAAELADGGLVPMLEAWSKPFPGMFVCYPKQRQMAPALRTFIDALRARVRD